jgi:hypothetical protein
MESQFKPITTDEYFDYLLDAKLDVEKILKKSTYEQYIELCKKYEDFLSPAAQNILSEYNTKTLSLEAKEKKTKQEEEVLKKFEQSFKDNNELENEGTVRKLTQSGYIDATIILAIILNVGFVIAMTIIGRI